MGLDPKNLAGIVCPTCGVEFCTTKSFDDRRAETHTPFYCPNGHPQSYPVPKGDSREVRKLKVRKLKGRIEQLEIRVAQLSAEHYDPAYVAFLEDHPDGYKRGVKTDVPTGG